MSSLSAILNTAGSAIRTYQAAISVTGQNIANVDNENYSIQTTEYTTSTPVSSDGQIYGTGVTVSSVTQEVDQLLENQLAAELSAQAALEEEEIYMTRIEDLFSEDSDDSLNTLLDTFWNTWESLSNTPAEDSLAEAVYAAGQELAARFNEIDADLEGMLEDLNTEITSGVAQVNALTTELAALNQDILSAESSGANANDLCDQRNALVDDLAALIDIDITVKNDGSYLITTGGLPLVEDQISHSLKVADNRVCWCGASGTTYDITDDISGGSLGGWLTTRDELIPEIRAELNELGSALVWTMNFQHSQGAGQTYFEGPLEGTYETDDSGTLQSLPYGDEIDYSQDFSMVIDENGSVQTVVVDMGISLAEIYGITGTGQADATYEITVIDEGVLGEQTLTQTAAGGGITAAGSVSDALDAALAEQTLTITGGDGTQEILISDNGSGAGRSAAQIAQELTAIDGITAYAASTEADFSLGGITDAQDGDILSFTLYADGVEETVAFTVDASAGTLEEQFEQALADAVEAINEANQNTDLMTDGCTIQSAAGATIGIQDFEVRDNAGVALGTFNSFNEGDTLTLTVATDAATPDQVDMTVDLTGVDTSDSAEVARAFYEAMTDQFEDTPFTVEFDESAGQVIVRTTDGTGLTLSAASGDTGNDASLSVTNLGTSTATGTGQLDFDGTDTEGAAASVGSADYIEFSLPGCGGSSVTSATTLVGESGGTYDTAAVITGSVTIIMDPGMAVTASDTTSAGLFGTSGSAAEGDSLITLGGTGGFTSFDDGDIITFDVDGITVSYTVTDPGTGLTDAEQAQQLYTALTAALPADEYQVIQNGTSVSIVRTAKADDPLTVTGFSDTGTDAALAVSTGTGTGAEAPENDTLEAGNDLKDSVVAATLNDPAVIFWEALDSNGDPTGESGYIEIDEPGTVVIEENGTAALTFEVSEGSLVAGNTLRINTDEDGAADPLSLSVTGDANSIDDTYAFTVTSGGSLPEESIVIEWSSGTSSGTLVIEGSANPEVPVSVAVDGMTLQLTGGTLVEGDVFYVTTDTSGTGTCKTLSDWHWTLTSFADEFNRSAGGVTASVTEDNTLVFDTDPDYCKIENISYSGADGISEENTDITVLDYTQLSFQAEDLTFSRTEGTWTVENDDGTIQIIPEGGDDDGFMVDLNGDGVGDLQISFAQAVTGDGTIQMDFSATDDEDFNFAFAGDEDGDSGLAAALGLNTFFTGTDAGTMGVNQVLADTDYMATGLVDTDTGEISSGDNTNALAMSNTRYTDLSMKQWDYTRGEAPTITALETSLDEYQATLASSVGLASQRVQTALDYAELMVYQLTAQRDSVSAVSLDEEMINLTAQQQAYSAAAKLLTAVDEMFETLLAIR